MSYVCSSDLPPLPGTPKQRRYWIHPHGSSRALLIAESARTHEGLLVAVTRDTQQAPAMEAELNIYAGGLTVMPFPDWETQPEVRRVGTVGFRTCNARWSLDHEKKQQE